MAMADPIDQQRLSFYTFLTSLLLAVGCVLYMIAPYLISLVMGGILALLARPSQRWLEARGLRPMAASALLTFGLVLVVVGPLLSFTAVALQQAAELAKTVARIDPDAVRDGVTSMASRLPLPAELLADHLGDIQAYLKDGLSDAGAGIASSILQAARGVPAGFLQMALASLACFCFLVDGPRFVTWLLAKIPWDADVRTRLSESFKDTAISVVWASMAAAAAQALIMWIGFLAVGVPAAFIAGGATFIFAWIPILGSTPVWLAGAAFLAFKAAYVQLGVLIGFGIAAGLVDNFVRPLVLRGRGEMHPLVSLVAIFGGLRLFGFFGVFLGPILAAVLITLLQVWPVVGRRWGLRFDPEAPPGEE